MQIKTLSIKKKSNWLLLLLALMWLSCGQNKTTSETTVDTLVIQEDSIIVKAAGDPNVYEIPADYPWLIKFVGDPFPWDTVGTCSRAEGFQKLFPAAIIKKEQVDDDLITLFKNGDSHIRVSEWSFDEMQDCGDNICEVVLTSDWVPLALGLHIGMSKSEFLKTLHFDERLKQNIYNYLLTSSGYSPIKVVFEFRNNLMSAFSYETIPCNSFTIRVPPEPIFIKLFNKPFSSNLPDSVQKAIKASVKIQVERDQVLTIVDKISESDMYPKMLFDSSSLLFRKWPQWEIVEVDLKSPSFSLINGIKVGMSRDEFLWQMGEKNFEGDVFQKSNRYCSDGFIRINDITVNFKEGFITSIQYYRSDCR